MSGNGRLEGESPLLPAHGPARRLQPSALALLLSPGLGVKRWAALAALGLVSMALGLGFIMAVPVSPKVLQIGRQLTLNWLPPLARGAAFAGLGVAVTAFAAWRLFHVMKQEPLAGQQARRVLMDMREYRARNRGPQVVAIGGGTGLATLLRGLKDYTRNITAVVTVADDGGSSGRLRRELSVPPPGDARNCLVALSDEEAMLGALMQYRFTNGAGLEGHSLGNLLLAALTDVAGGFDRGLIAAAHLLAINGRVVPSTLASNVVLMGVTTRGHVVQGESRVGTAPDSLRRVWLEPEGTLANPQAVEAVQRADIVVIGPGSLYTSIIPNLLARGLREAMEASRAPKVFVCNVATQSGETDGYGVSEHWRAFEAHTGVKVTHLVVNSNVAPLPQETTQVAVPPVRPEGFQGTFIPADIVDAETRTRHDPAKLARVIMDIAAHHSRHE